ncbi:hypothetical protein G3R49_19580 [Shewanella sp. WXL01]|uniref:Uncharacterized protein n=1 Tax=Shewanella maritima TaxID=2520507 RepID=A0A411PIF1_9GAMM|nr:MULTISPECIES: hypothetical protein [Shewanella]NKF52761.1 hypothetical protein [Shewanella sp. WXL01]QBF83369.1 hypothetical protein EXU30_12175 [Shewanella maritima]
MYNLIKTAQLGLLFATTVSLSAQLYAQDDSPFAVSLISGMEAYPESPDSSLSRGVGARLIYSNLRYVDPYQLGANHYDIRLSYFYEKDSEKYDEDRYRDSMDWKLRYQRPLMAFGDNDDYLLSIHARHEGHYNSQQLEEFEMLTLAGVALDRRFGSDNYYDLGFVAALGYSNEEKDDDWPRENGGHGEDVLGRKGYGYYLEWNNAYTFAHSGVQLNATLRTFQGNWKYDAGQFYVQDQLNINVIVPLANQNHLLTFATQYIKRDYELDLIGFEDVLYRAAASYTYYF